MYKYWKGEGAQCRFCVWISIYYCYYYHHHQYVRSCLRGDLASQKPPRRRIVLRSRRRLWRSGPIATIYIIYNIIIVCHNGNVNRQTADDYVEFLGIHSSTIMGPAFDTYVYSIICMGCRVSRYNTRGIVTHKVYDAYYVYIWYVYNIKYVIDINIIILSIRRDRKHNVGVFDILISWDFWEKIRFVTGFSVDTDSKQRPEQKCPGLPYAYSPNIHI